MTFLTEKNVMIMKANKVIPKAKIILFGPVGFKGTEAFCNVVNAGVCINNFACAC